MANPMSKRWCFTINYSEESPWFPEVAWKPADMEYMVCQRELAPTTGKTHWQGYVRCATRKRMTTIKRLLNRDDAHLEIAKGTEQQCKDYCTKIASRAVDDAEPFERGNFNPEEGSHEGQGRRSDLEAAAAMIDSGASMLEVAQTHQSDFIRYHGGLMQYKALKDSAALKQARDVRVEIWWGPGGHGKTHWARQAGGGQSVYSVEAILHPWDSYTGETTIMMDEFKWESWPIDTMKRLMDKWPWELPARYSNKYAAWRRVIILLNNSPATLYSAATGPDLAAFRRRVHRIIYLDHRVESIEELEKLTDADNEYLFGINQFIL